MLSSSVAFKLRALGSQQACGTKHASKFFLSPVKKNTKIHMCPGHQTHRQWAASPPTSVHLNCEAGSPHSGSICCFGRSQEIVGMRNKPDPGIKMLGHVHEIKPQSSLVSHLFPSFLRPLAILICCGAT